MGFSLIGGLCGDLSPHRTTFAFWVAVVVREEGHEQSDRSGPRDTLTMRSTWLVPDCLGRHASGVAIENVMAEIDIFASSTGNFKIITLDHITCALCWPDARAEHLAATTGHLFEEMKATFHLPGILDAGLSSNTSGPSARVRATCHPPGVAGGVAGKSS